MRFCVSYEDDLWPVFTELWVKGQVHVITLVIFLDVYITVNVRDSLMEQNVLSVLCQHSETDFNLSEGLKHTGLISKLWF